MAVRILMVCLGNICRSPLAEGILKSKTTEDRIEVDSAGTGRYHLGSPPDSRSIAVAKKHGLDISEQRCRQFTRKDFRDFSHIYVMDKANYRDVISLAQNEEEIKKVSLILSEMNIGLEEVPDPYYDAQDGFENVYRLLDEACGAIANKLNSL